MTNDAKEVHDLLSAILEQYEQTLATHGVERPYVKAG
jgi:hypothetical protein